MSISVVGAIAAAGAAGAVARFFLTELVRGLCGTFPCSTLVVNVLGCFLFGALYGLGHDRWTPLVQAAVLTGFLGSFTTFSTFAFDCQTLMEQGRWPALVANVLAQNGAGIVAIWGGAAVASAVRTGA